MGIDQAKLNHALDAIEAIKNVNDARAVLDRAEAHHRRLLKSGKASVSTKDVYTPVENIGKNAVS